MRPKKSEIVGAAVIIVFILVVLGAGLYTSLRAAPRDQCLANLKSVSTALSLYAGDNWGHMPPGERWVDALGDSLVTNWGTFVCPETRLTKEEAQALQAADGRPLPVGYSIFQPLAGSDVTRISDPENTPWLFDSGQVRSNSTAGINALAFRHYGKAGNIFFADGSAKSVTQVPQVPSPLFKSATAEADEAHVHAGESDHDHDDGAPVRDQRIPHGHGHVHGPDCDH